MTDQPFIGSDILPGAAFAFQRIWADHQWGRAAAIDTDIIRRVKDPWTCPAELLDWLAFAKSVDIFELDWPEARKRAVIAASAEVHRIKGTRKAVRLALEALGVPATITEWWQVDPPDRRGTFRVTLDVSSQGNAVDLALLRNARRQVSAAKPKSRVFSVDLAGSVAGPLYLGGAGFGLTVSVIYPSP